MKNIFPYCKAIMDILSGFQDEDIIVIIMITIYPNIA